MLEDLNNQQFDVDLNFNNETYAYSVVKDDVIQKRSIRFLPYLAHEDLDCEHLNGRHYCLSDD